MFAKCFAKIILQYVPEGSRSWKYNHYFPVAKGEGKTSFYPSKTPTNDPSCFL